MPVVHFRRTKPKVGTRINLFVAAGGRCEFDNCNVYLLEHPVTQRAGNYAQVAHIVAFSDGGPRAEAELSPEERDDLANLMLLCPICHKEVDDNPESYPVSVLKEFKQAHEERIFLLTSTKPDRHTVVLVMKANIDSSPVEIPLAHVREAVAPWYLDQREVATIDLTKGDEYGTPDYWSTAAQTIIEQTRAFYRRPLESGPLRHVSVFALAPIPLLILLGSCISNKIPTALYQRHRDNDEKWTWKAAKGNVASYRFEQIQDGDSGSAAALVLSLSGQVPAADWKSKIPSSTRVYEIALSNRAQSPRFLESREDLRAFRDTYLAAMRTITAKNPHLEELHLFPAVPAPVAVAIGLDRMPKRDPRLVVYDYRNEFGGFSPTVEVPKSEAE